VTQKSTSNPLLDKTKDTQIDKIMMMQQPSTAIEWRPAIPLQLSTGNVLYTLDAFINRLIIASGNLTA
jgi:hypothetical protein